MTVAEPTSPTVFEVYGHFDTPCGLRVSAENTVAMLRDKGALVRLHTVGDEHQTAVEGPVGERTSPRVNLLHINPVTVLAMSRDRHESFHWEDRLNVCVPFWELPRVPEFWLPVLRGMDLVLAPTQFIADAVTASDPSIPVQHFPQTVSISDDIAPDRQRFGFPDGVTVFGTSFAAQAVIERKNPWAVIDAFRLAFPTEPDVRLVVRAYDAGNGDPTDLLARLAQVSGDDSRIVVMSERLDYADVMSLYASYDAFVSLHRSEGLGLGPMEAMSVGTPVVATAWSGVMDFMTPENSCLVEYDLVPVDVGPDSPYGSLAMSTAEKWAEPRLDSAAEQLRRIHFEPETRAALGQRAKTDMAARHREILKAPFVGQLAEMARQVSKTDSIHAARAHSLDQIERREFSRYPGIAFRRTAVRILRALRLKPPAPESERRSGT